MTYIIKIIIWGVILVFILGYSLYSGLLSGLSTSISNFNTNFIAFLPIEIKTTILIIVFGLIVGFIYNIKD